MSKPKTAVELLARRPRVPWLLELTSKKRFDCKGHGISWKWPLFDWNSIFGRKRTPSLQTMQACWSGHQSSRKILQKNSKTQHPPQTTETSCFQTTYKSQMLRRCANSIDIMSTRNVEISIKTNCGVKSMWKTRKSTVLQNKISTKEKKNVIPTNQDGKTELLGPSIGVFCSSP